MSIRFQVLGRPFQDNALFVLLDSGCGQTRFLFDCGMGTLQELSRREIQRIDHVCFSHFHFDHIGGFDHFLRFNFTRGPAPVNLWGPPGALSILHHRLQGYVWNLVADSQGRMQIGEIHPDSIDVARFNVREGYAEAHRVGAAAFRGVVAETDTYRLDAWFLDHHIPSLAFKLTEKNHSVVDLRSVERLGLAPGPWLKDLKNPHVLDDLEILLDGRRFTAGYLRSQVLRNAPGESLAFLTDFRLPLEARAPLCDWLADVDVMVCESHFLHRDAEMAWTKGHMTAKQAGELARDAHVAKLILFHLSERYRESESAQFLTEAKEAFPNVTIAGIENL